MGGVYPGPGITLGPALTFAHLAASDAVARAANSRFALSHIPGKD
jgi:hypothetical protein